MACWESAKHFRTEKWFAGRVQSISGLRNGLESVDAIDSLCCTSETHSPQLAQCQARLACFISSVHRRWQFYANTCPVCVCAVFSAHTFRRGAPPRLSTGPPPPATLWKLRDAFLERPPRLNVGASENFFFFLCCQKGNFCAAVVEQSTELQIFAKDGDCWAESFVFMVFDFVFGASVQIDHVR